MHTPPSPSVDQLRQALTPLTAKLTKRNLRVTIRLFNGESIRSVAQSVRLSHERTTAIALDVTLTLKLRLLTEEQRRAEFASPEAHRLSDYRHPERLAWWLPLLEALVPDAPTERDFMLDKRISGINLYSRCVSSQS